VSALEQPSTTPGVDRPLGIPTRRLRSAARAGARLAGAIVLLVGLGGWPSMMPASALGLVLAGAALMLLAPERRRRSAVITGRVCAIAVVLTSGAALVEYAAGANFGIDRLAVWTGPRPGGVHAGRPSPAAAGAFLLAGAALLLLDARGQRRPSPATILAPLAAVVPTVAMLGYAFGIPELYSVPSVQPFTGMAVHTAMAALLLCVGILAARPDEGFMAVLTSEHAGGLIARRMVLGLLAFVPVAFLVLLGRRLGLYPEPVVSALLVFFALVEGLTFIDLTTSRLDADDLGRKRAERRVRELVEQAPDGVFVAGHDGRYIDINSAGCRMLGYSREELLGKGARDLIPPEDLPRLAADRLAMLGGATRMAEWKMRRRDGSWLPVEVSARLLVDGRWQAFIRDITDRKRHQEEIERARETDHQLRAELEEVTSAALTVSEAVAALPEPDVPEVMRIFALQAQLLTGARYVALGLGHDPDAPFEPWVSLGASEAMERALGHPPRSIGAQRPTPSFLGVPIRYRGRIVGNLYLADKRGAGEFSEKDGRMVEMLATRAAVAIETARLYAGEVAQRTWLQSIIDQMPEGVMLLNESGGVEAMNRALLALSSDDPEAVDPWGNPAIFDVREPDGTPVPFADYLVVRALTRGEVATDHEHFVRVRDGRMVPVLVSAAPIRDEDGLITGAVAVIRDVTALKELERLREEWASVVAHDLRQPVGAISLTAESLIKMHEGEPSAKERRAVERIRSASLRLNRMIEDLLDASRIEAKRLSVEPRLVDFRGLVDAVLESHRESAAGRPVKVSVERGQAAWIDPDRIHQVLGNLLSNAVKYGAPGSEITIHCSALDDTLEVSVTNEGGGIPADELPRLFSRFGRARSARAAGTPGLGLGLYIARGLVEAHGGRMWAESVPGASTSFHFTIPTVAPNPERVSSDAHAPA
jgi:PAS domain S-box-containing protein